MPTDAYGVYYPASSQAPATAADMMQMADSLSDRLILRATDAADRDAQFGDAPAGAEVVTTQAPFYRWLKTGPAVTDWLTLYSDTGVLDGIADSSLFTTAANFTLGSYARGRVLNGVTSLQFEVTYTGSSPLSGSNVGNIPDSNVITVPTVLRPPQIVVGTAKFSFTSGACQMYSSGTVVLADLHSNGNVNNGDIGRFHFTFLSA